ncbi:AraC family transcriptional regulator [Cupriavidus sp. USMAHM13]|uniref:GlxA family transcriptional regulator n=1 Tax=Cupriavidus sp. USMAHM13 TaxID=1389192 RepID=UPI0008A6FA79|nr:helix-turn-helix domain-containing protein [Cupriavidus sp. USMAHM13]AOZ04181.1 AraC family transcriptional regulator [Cupriavidus sp. USMAHM13]
MPPPTPCRIGLLLYPECMPAGLFAFADLVHAANRRAGTVLFEPMFVAAQAGVVECAHGHSLKAGLSAQEACLDAILIPGLWAESSGQIASALAKNADMITVLAGLQESVMMWSYCTGVCLAAATGRLNGQKATITWWLADMVREQYPKAVWQTERTIAYNSRTATASGINGYLPIAQTFIETRLSKEAYRDLTKLMVLPRPERTHHAFQMMSLIEQPDRLLRELHRITEQISATEATVSRLAQELNMTERTLARKVVAATGLPVASYVRRIKLNQVSERLIHTSAPASTISAELGFSSDSGMRRMFKDLTALTPAQYRQAFGRSWTP